MSGEARARGREGRKQLELARCAMPQTDFKGGCSSDRARGGEARERDAGGGRWRRRAAPAQGRARSGLLSSSASSSLVVALVVKHLGF